MEALQQTAQRLVDESIPAWRDVKKHEPPKDTPILVYGELLNEAKVVIWCELNKGWRLAVADLGNSIKRALILEYEFTHWMPCPEPPKEGL